ncbi:MAG: sulfotransferase [Actinomycetota bacterium]
MLYIGGLGRSGSTLVDRILGQAPGTCSVGEFVFLWDRGLMRDERCGCGEAFRRCGFWEEVGRRAVGGWDALDAAATLRLQRSVDRNRYLPLMLAPWLAPAYARRLRAYADLLGRVYEAVAHTAGASMIVDSSKQVSTAAVLRHVPGIDVRLLQLVRDPRAVAFSWGKTVARPDAPDSFMARTGPVRTAVRWLATNAAFAILRLAPGSLRPAARYEDVVRTPGPWAHRILVQTGAASTAPIFADERTALLGIDHSISGNPMRFRTGPVEIVADDAWRSQMPRRDRVIVGAITLPLRVVGGYRGRAA